MFDIISYWVVYTTLILLILSFPLYWTCDIIDLIIKDLTNGKFVNAFSNKFRNPWLVKVGLHKHYEQNKLCNDYGGRNTFIIITSSCCSIASIIILFVEYMDQGVLPYTTIANVTEIITPYVTTPILLLVGFVLIRGIVKKAFRKYEDLESKLSKLK